MKLRPFSSSGEKQLLHHAGWAAGQPLLPALRKAAATAWTTWTATRDREGGWTVDARAPGARPAPKGKCKDKSDYCLACKDRAFDDCFACCDRSAWNCECKPGALSAGSIAACSAESAQCAIGALDGLPARSP